MCLVSYLIPGSVGEHASKEGVHVPGIHGLAVLLDTLSICKDEGLPQQGIAFSEAVCNLPASQQTGCLSSKMQRLMPHMKCTIRQVS